MYRVAALTSAAALLPQAAGFTSTHAKPNDPKPDRGVVTQPYGYTAFAKDPEVSEHKSGGGSGGSSTETSKPSCVLLPGTATSFDVCGQNVSPNAADHAASMGPDSTPSVTPQELAQQAFSSLKLPALTVRTAPPRGRDGLVGLREFFWAERARWHPLSKRAEAGGAWAEVTAVPSRLVVRPGTGDSVMCEGSGTPFDFSRPSAAQGTGCTYLYERSSAGMPGSAYQVTAEAVWTATWVGSGGVGGVLPSQTRSSSFSLRIAEGQALTQGRS
ncbi:hypothetical protein [Actinomadura rupiterrae]|uniref:hypothetical protein n=1 Tax=Actinomadura rupiterrae TaxID=559627 RepID=UPI0020A4D246|nr:hypothetical protein [Actinomadura rupiterrae]MCP2337518.1 hypothetical protein [Actinomadura rupiterrae]